MDDNERKLNELEQKIEELGEQLEQVIANPLTRDMDKQTTDRLQELTSQRIFDIVWEDYYYFSTIFEGVSRVTAVTTGAGAVSVTSDGLHLSNASSGDANADIQLGDATGVMLFDKRTRFRTSVQASHTTDYDATIQSLSDSSGGFIDFRIQNGSIIGRTNDGSSTSTVTVGTITVDTDTLLEFDYYPGERVDFYVDGLLEGSLTQNLPTDGGGTKTLLGTSVTTTSGTARTLTLEYMDFLQKK